MKKWIYFAGLKTLELCALALACWAFYWVGRLLVPAAPWYVCVIVGVAGFCAAIACILLIWYLIFDAIPAIIRKNIEWADKLSKRKE
jgi:hypothetical protein